MGVPPTVTLIADDAAEDPAGCSETERPDSSYKAEEGCNSTATAPTDADAVTDSEANLIKMMYLPRRYFIHPTPRTRRRREGKQPSSASADRARRAARRRTPI
jgi:hypothetical protein